MVSEENAEIVRRFLAGWNRGDGVSSRSVRLEMDEIRPIDETRVLSFFRYVVGGEGQRSFETAFAAIHTVREGSVISAEIFKTREEALEAAGLSE